MRDGPIILQQQDSGGSFDSSGPTQLTKDIMNIAKKTVRPEVQLPFQLDKEIDDQINRILNGSTCSEDHRPQEESWFKESATDFDNWDAKDNSVARERELDLDRQRQNKESEVKGDQERLDRERMDRERIDRERMGRDRGERERSEREKIDRERLDRERNGREMQMQRNQHLRDSNREMGRKYEESRDVPQPGGLIDRIPQPSQFSPKRGPAGDCIDEFRGFHPNSNDFQPKKLPDPKFADQSTKFEHQPSKFDHLKFNESSTYPEPYIEPKSYNGTSEPRMIRSQYDKPLPPKRPELHITPEFGTTPETEKIIQQHIVNLGMGPSDGRPPSPPATKEYRRYHTRGFDRNYGNDRNYDRGYGSSRYENGGSYGNGGYNGYQHGGNYNSNHQQPNHHNGNYTPGTINREHRDDRRNFDRNYAPAQLHSTPSRRDGGYDRYDNNYRHDGRNSSGPQIDDFETGYWNNGGDDRMRMQARNGAYGGNQGNGNYSENSNCYNGRYNNNGGYGQYEKPPVQRQLSPIHYRGNNSPMRVDGKDFFPDGSFENFGGQSYGRNFQGNQRVYNDRYNGNDRSFNGNDRGYNYNVNDRGFDRNLGNDRGYGPGPNSYNGYHGTNGPNGTNGQGPNGCVPHGPINQTGPNNNGRYSQNYDRQMQERNHLPPAGGDYRY